MAWPLLIGAAVAPRATMVQGMPGKPPAETARPEVRATAKPETPLTVKPALGIDPSVQTLAAPVCNWSLGSFACVPLRLVRACTSIPRDVARGQAVLLLLSGSIVPM